MLVQGIFYKSSLGIRSSLTWDSRKLFQYREREQMVSLYFSKQFRAYLDTRLLIRSVWGHCSAALGVLHSWAKSLILSMKRAATIFAEIMQTLSKIWCQVDELRLMSRTNQHLRSTTRPSLYLHQITTSRQAINPKVGFVGYSSFRSSRISAIVRSRNSR
ncbi:hypothetical protein D3C71_925570 [compost metagenome]